MKTARRRGARHAKGSNPARTPAPSLAMTFPNQATPVIRGVMRDAINVEIGASAIGCEQCFAACRAHGGPLQSVCEAMCASVCKA
jgi:hypothetical protein